MKILIYCTQAKPWLYYNEQKKKYALRYGKRKDTDLNGTVCFKCECKEAFKYDFVHRSGDSSNFYIRDQRTERMKDCLSNDDLFDYGKGKTLYAYHFEKVKAINPFLPTELYLDFDCTKPLKQAPQSYCHVYWNHLVYHDWHDPKNIVNLAQKTEEAIYFSVQSPWLCKIVNGEKDLEVRKTCPKEIERK